jgi:hypothetical protein
VPLLPIKGERTSFDLFPRAFVLDQVRRYARARPHMVERRALPM